MEMAKVTSKGQITIPVSIRKRLSINEGDKVLFLDTSDGVMMVNPDVRPAEAAEKKPDVTVMERIDTVEPEFSEAEARENITGTMTPLIKPSQTQSENERKPLHENQYDVNKLLDEIRSFREKY